MPDCPTRTGRDKAETFLPIQAIDLVDNAINIVVQARGLQFDGPMKRDELLDRPAYLSQRIGLEAATFEPCDHARLRVGRQLGHFSPGIGEETERARRGDRRV